MCIAGGRFGVPLVAFSGRHFSSFSCARRGGPWRRSPFFALPLPLLGHKGAIALGAAPGLAQDCAKQQVRFSQHPYKPPSREIFHPNIPDPTPTSNSCPVPSSPAAACLSPTQLYIPRNFYWRQRIEQVRSGLYLGGDEYPWNFLVRWKYWAKRKYNTTHYPIPTDKSKIKGVDYYPRLKVFACQWMEDGVHRIRRFRQAYGVARAREAAEKFRTDLEATGRVDGRLTLRQARLKMADKRAKDKLKKQSLKHIHSGKM
eukprot:GHVT01090631.1.p1 GENE.GHVT01090631.1~~GHVT01090631.1.p1  ORF type:complete len:258 (+),score=23.96 GHVT01090631.1:492-1265(+)